MPRYNVTGTIVRHTEFSGHIEADDPDDAKRRFLNWVEEDDFFDEVDGDRIECLSHARRKYHVELDRRGER